MNMREYWANEAAMMRDKSGVLGKEVLMPVSANPKRKSNDKSVRTGYWLEGSKIIFSTYIYNATSLPDDAVKIFLSRAKIIQENFKGAGYSFEFRYELVTSPRYDYKQTYRLYKGSNPKLLKYRPQVSDSSNRGDLPWITDEKDLPCEYYMELFDQVAGAGADGGTHAHPLDRTESCYFAVFVSKELNNPRTLIHEAFHPVLEHSYVSSPKNPIYAIYSDFFQTIKGYLGERPSGMELSNYNKIIGRYIRANEVLKGQAKTIRENIMTTVAITKSGEAQHSNIVFYLYDYLTYPELFDGFNSGKLIDNLQIEYIVKALAEK